MKIRPDSPRLPKLPDDKGAVDSAKAEKVPAGAPEPPIARARASREAGRLNLGAASPESLASQVATLGVERALGPGLPEQLRSDVGEAVASALRADPFLAPLIGHLLPDEGGS